MARPVRTRNAEATQAAILTAARDCFARESYDQVGVRDIATLAGVDAALVCRYFGSKEDLFAELLLRSDKPLDVLEAGREGLCLRITEMVAQKPDDEETVQDLLIMLRSVSSKTAASLVHAAMKKRFDEPVAQLLEGDNTHLRSRLMGSVIIGLIISKIVSGPWDCDEDSQAAFNQRIEDILRLSIREFQTPPANAPG